MCVCVCVYIYIYKCAFVGVDNKLYKMHGTYIKFPGHSVVIYCVFSLDPPSSDVN